MRSSVRLAAAGRPDEHDELARLDREVDAVDHLVGAVRLDDVAQQDFGHRVSPCALVASSGASSASWMRRSAESMPAVDVTGRAVRRASRTTLVCASPASTIRFCPVIAARLVGREEQRGARDVVLRQPELEALLVEELAARPRARPTAPRWRSVTIAPGTIALTRMLRSPSSRASTRVMPGDRRLRRRVAGHRRPAAHPRDRAEVDDRAAARGRHRRRHRLRGEEVVAQVDREVVVPVLGRHVVDRVAVVARGVVDEHADRAPAPSRTSAIAARSAAMSRTSQCA